MCYDVNRNWKILLEAFTLPTPFVEIVSACTHKMSSWWRHQMETFSALLAICAENSQVPGEFPTQRPVTRSFDVFFDLRLHGRFSKQSPCWWFETPSCPFWRHNNVVAFMPAATNPQAISRHQVTIRYCCFSSVLKSFDVCSLSNLKYCLLYNLSYIIRKISQSNITNDISNLM